MLLPGARLLPGEAGFGYDPALGLDMPGVEPVAPAAPPDAPLAPPDAPPDEAPPDEPPPAEPPPPDCAMAVKLDAASKMAAATHVICLFMKCLPIAVAR